MVHKSFNSRTKTPNELGSDLNKLSQMILEAEKMCTLYEFSTAVEIGQNATSPKNMEREIDHLEKNLKKHKTMITELYNMREKTLRKFSHINFPRYQLPS